MSWPFSSPDSVNGGYWRGREGSLDWCEENYLHSPYIAETTNTLSNLSYITLALYGIWKCRKEGLPTRFVLCNISLLCVGLGSAAYHGTLRHWAQMFDEIPMLYTVAFVTYTVLDVTPASSRPSIFLPAALIAIAFAWTDAYVRIQTPAFHEISFAILGLFTTFRVLFLLNTPAFAPNNTVTRKIRNLFYEGFAIFISGFFAWNLDNWYCKALRAWRVDIGWPATWFAQGHAYWHLATGFGAYRMIVASELLYLVLARQQYKYEVKGVLFPVVSRLRSSGYRGK